MEKEQDALPQELRSFIEECLAQKTQKTCTKSCASNAPDLSLCMEENASYIRRQSTLITNTINEDGELLDHQEVGMDVLVKGNESFFFLFAKHLGVVLQLEGNEIKVLLWCAMNANLNTNEIVLNKVIKQRLADTAKIHLRGVENSLTKLCKKNMLRRIGLGVYVVNPETTWKGKINEKAKSVRLYTNYTIESNDII